MVSFIARRRATRAVARGGSGGGTGGDYIPMSYLGAAGGVATLDASARITPSQVRPASKRLQTIANASGMVTLNWASYDEITVLLIGDVTFTMTGAIAGQACVLEIVQNLAGNHTVTLPSNVRRSIDIPAYSATQTPNSRDKLGFLYDSGESKYDLVAISRGVA